jgi:tRNA pseudouridine55 synthase
MMDINGILVIDKPQGVTSHDIVAKIKKLIGVKRVGHTGTLDPMATGVLGICIGKATRIAEYLSSKDKEYLAEAVFGIVTDSLDTTGRVLQRVDASAIGEEDILAATRCFVGEIMQIPPMVSAVHHEGKRLYELAREGKRIERQPRRVLVSKMELLEFHPGDHPVAKWRVECSSGVYVRALCADIGEKLGFGAAMSSLRRIRAGAFDIANALTLDHIKNLWESGSLTEALTPIPVALKEWGSLVLDHAMRERILHGQAIEYPASFDAGEKVLLLDDAGEAVSLAHYREGVLSPFKVLV